MMIKYLLIGLLLAALSTPLCFATTTSSNLSKPSIQSGLQHLLAQKQNAHMGLVVADPATGKILFKERADYLFSPASTLKVFPAVAALHFLGPDFRFNTSLLTNGRINNHALEGDLIVKFTGDPELTSEDLKMLISKLSAAGIHKITGHVDIDNSDYETIPYPPGSLWDDLSYGYAAPLDAIIIDRNKFILHLMPSTTEHGRPALAADMLPGVVTFDNKARTTAQNEKGCPLTIYSDIDHHYHIGGCINRAFGQQRRTLAVRNPFLYARTLINAALQENHIQYTASIGLKNAAPHMVVLAEHTSPPLSIMLREMLKNSDNLTTNSLLKKMGQLYFKTPGSWRNGLLALKKILAPTGIDFKQCLINDGAGLSRYNLITPQQFSQLLNFAYRNPSVRTAFWPALPIAGQDGTLVFRMQPFASGGRVHAKTGTMTGISALAGYVNTQHHGLLSFVIMVNGFVGKDRPFKHLQDQICEFLIRQN